MPLRRPARFVLVGVVLLGAAAGAQQDLMPKKPLPPGVTRAVADLDSDNPLVQSAAREWLRGLDPQTRADAIDPVARMLAAKKPTTRSAAALALGDLGPVARPAVGRLTVCLRDDNSTVRYMAATALGRIGPGVADAVPALTRVLKDDSVYVRVAAARALFCVAEDVTAIPVLVAALDDPHPGHRWNAALVLGLYGPRAKSSAEALRRRLRDEDMLTRINAAEALWRVARDAEAVPALVREMKADCILRYVAADVLWEVNRDPEVIDTLIAALRHSDWIHRFLAALSLGRIGPPAGKAVAALRKLTDDEDEQVREVAASAIAAIEKPAK